MKVTIDEATAGGLYANFANILHNPTEFVFDFGRVVPGRADVKVVQACLRHASAKTTLDTYGHLWPDTDESTGAAIDAVLATRAEQSRNRQATS